MRMKRLKLILPIALLLFLAIFFFFHSTKSDPNAPRYVPAHSQPTGPFGYEFVSGNREIPFHDGKSWIFTIIPPTNLHEYLYDVDNRKVLGELLNGDVALANSDQTKFLCLGSDSPLTSFKSRLASLLARATFGKIQIAPKHVEYYWFLDLKNNSSRRAGEYTQTPGYAGGFWHSSPDFRYGYNAANNSADEGKAFYLCDLDQESFDRINFAGEPLGWWDNRTLFARDPSHNLVLFDVATHKTSILLTFAAVKKRLAELQITDYPIDFTAEFNWNGKNFDIYITGVPDFPSPTHNSFLLKLDRPGLNLKLIRRDFKFEWLGNLDATGDRYLYANLPGLYYGHGGVYLRYVTNDTEQTIVQPGNSNSWSFPKFYRDSVIYSRDGVLWRTDLNGSNTTRLFAPAVTN
jgi:hypothetical protein